MLLYEVVIPVIPNSNKILTRKKKNHNQMANLMYIQNLSPLAYSIKKYMGNHMKKTLTSRLSGIGTKKKQEKCSLIYKTQCKLPF